MSESTMTEEQSKQWIRDQFQAANKHLAGKGIMPKSVVESDSRYLVGLVAVWKIKANDNKTYWVISGDVPTDHLDVGNATDARDAMRAFALNWQLKSEQILQSGTQDNTQKQFAHMMITRAEGLYQIYEDANLWGSKPS